MSSSNEFGVGAPVQFEEEEQEKWSIFNLDDEKKCKYYKKVDIQQNKKGLEFFFFNFKFVFFKEKHTCPTCLAGFAYCELVPHIIECYALKQKLIHKIPIKKGNGVYEIIDLDADDLNDDEEDEEVQEKKKRKTVNIKPTLISKIPNFRAKQETGPKSLIPLTSTTKTSNQEISTVKSKKTPITKTTTPKSIKISTTSVDDKKMNDRSARKRSLSYDIQSIQNHSKYLVSKKNEKLIPEIPKEEVSTPNNGKKRGRPCKNTTPNNPNTPITTPIPTPTKIISKSDIFSSPIPSSSSSSSSSLSPISPTSPLPKKRSKSNSPLIIENDEVEAIDEIKDLFLRLESGLKDSWIQRQNWMETLENCSTIEEINEKIIDFIENLKHIFKSNEKLLIKKSTSTIEKLYQKVFDLKSEIDVTYFRTEFKIEHWEDSWRKALKNLRKK